MLKPNMTVTSEPILSPEPPDFSNMAAVKAPELVGTKRTVEFRGDRKQIKLFEELFQEKIEEIWDVLKKETGSKSDG